MVREISHPSMPRCNKGQLINRLGSLAVLSAIVLSTGVEQAIARSPVAPTQATHPPTLQLAQRQEQRRPTARLPRGVMRQIRRDLAERFNIPRRDIRLVSYTRETWPDSCLGLAGPNERCAMAIVEGWRVEVTHGQQNWVYRSDRTAQVLRLETRDLTVLPPDVMERLVQTVAQQQRVPASSVRVVEVNPATFDGCMGIYQSGQACTQIAIFGWQTIVSSSSRSWVYHISQTGDRIVQNPTASGTRENLVPSFIPEGNEAEPEPESVVMRVTVAGSMDGTRSSLILMADGTLYKHVWRPNLPAPVEPTVEKRISQQQVRQFRQLLDEQAFPNLNGLRYITDAAFADYPTTTIQAMGSQVEYIDLEEANLPAALQAVIQAWNDL